MLYTHQNAPGAVVYDCDANPKVVISRVLSVDTRTGQVEVDPVRSTVIVARKLAERVDVIEFDRIETEVDMDMKIKAFHCFGRLQ